MNAQKLIAQLAEHRQASPTKNFETVSLGLANTKKAKPTPEEQVIIDKMRVRRDIVEDAKNRINLSYDDAGDLF